MDFIFVNFHSCLAILFKHLDIIVVVIINNLKLFIFMSSLSFLFKIYVYIQVLILLRSNHKKILSLIPHCLYINIIKMLPSTIL